MQDDNQTLSVSSTDNDHKLNISQMLFVSIYIFSAHCWIFSPPSKTHHWRWCHGSILCLSHTVNNNFSWIHVYNLQADTTAVLKGLHNSLNYNYMYPHHTSNIKSIAVLLPLGQHMEQVDGYLIHIYNMYFLHELGRLMEHKTKPCTSCAN